MLIIYKDKLDTFFKGDTTISKFHALEELNEYRRNPDTNMEDFLIEFQLKLNKVKAAGTTVSDDVIGYKLLNSANLDPGTKKHSFLGIGKIS